MLAAVKILQGAVQTNTFIKAREMLRWINVKSDPEITDWFHAIFHNTPGIMAWMFQPTPGVLLAITSILDLMKENYLDDEIVHTVMELFSKSYGANDQYLFIPPLQISLWNRNVNFEWKKDQVKSG